MLCLVMDLLVNIIRFNLIITTGMFVGIVLFTVWYMLNLRPCLFTLKLLHRMIWKMWFLTTNVSWSMDCVSFLLSEFGSGERQSWYNSAWLGPTEVWAESWKSLEKSGPMNNEWRCVNTCWLGLHVFMDLYSVFIYS